MLWWLYQEHQLQSSLSCSIFFFHSHSKVQVLILLFALFQFYPMVCQDSKVSNSETYLGGGIIKPGDLAEIRGSVCISKSYRSLCVSISSTGSWLCIYHLLVWSNISFLHNFQWITSPIQLCLVLYSFCANLLHSLIMWLMISSLSPHNLHLFCCVLSIYAFYLLRGIQFPFLSLIHS